MTTLRIYLFMIIFGVLIGLLASGVILLIAQQPRGKPLVLSAAPSPAPLRVHVSGAVLKPGVYAMDVGSRVEDALWAAGGISAQAAVDDINLAAPLKDGSQVIVPKRGDGSYKVRMGNHNRLDLNSAGQVELEGLPGIGPVIAANILKYREEHGLFMSIESIQEVPGIGSGIFEQIKELITVQ